MNSNQMPEQRYCGSKFTLSILLLLVSMLSLQAYCQVDGTEYNWIEKLNKDGIQVFTSRVEGSPFKAVRGTMVVDASASSLIALVMDVDKCKQWAVLCKQSRVEKTLSDVEAYVYTHNDVPFPIKDRDVFAHVLWQQDNLTGKISMTSVATKNLVPMTKGVVRIENALSQWHFTALHDDKVLVESYAQIDPNGPTPAWLSNMLLVDSPYKTMKNMRAIVESGGYAEATVSFIKQRPLE